MKRPWLRPLVPVYAAGAALRWAGLKPKRLAWPVISVGNLSTGGTGKTPFTIALARLLLDSGFAVDVLSRGYGRRGNDIVRVDPEGSPERFGDEPLLIARATGVPVYVGADRWEAGSIAEREASRAGVHLLDDGFQHRKLARQVDIVLVNSGDLADSLLPAGNLREPLSALQRATILAVPSDDTAAVARLHSLGLSQPIWRFRREMSVPQTAGPVLAFCGIARPEQFFAGIQRSGVTIAVRKVFRDHHRFRVRDLQLLEWMADRNGASAALTTEKDRIRIGDLTAYLGQMQLLTAGLEVSFDDPKGVVDSLLAQLRQLEIRLR
ncbi:MAG TPA: tetraacyldisaccharide 4'-kinase [Acidobacteriaceae bacterium]|nr:tetraacyldisaccharide 4'-kinase [Acidobacteriaceae bacterium]